MRYAAAAAGLGAARSRSQTMKKSAKQKDVAYTPNPILAVRLPMWRSKFVVFLLFMAFVALAGRAFWIQGPGNAFFKKQGESRYQRTLEMPATRGQIRDRNGLVLATSLPVKAIWAIPKPFRTISAQTSSRNSRSCSTCRRKTCARSCRWTRRSST